jgi:pimeloyl-ACP methyl ester carboxylesterase
LNQQPAIAILERSKHGARRVLPLLALLMYLAACVQYQLGDSEAALALEDIVAGSGSSRLKARTPSPSRSTIEYSVDQRSYRGDLYVSPEGVKAGIVLVPGVVAAGKDDARLVALAYTLARLQFAVLVPDLRSLRKYRVRKRNVREVADAFRYLISRPGLAPQGRAGIAGFSYGAGPVLLAALQPDVRDQVRFIVTLGGYYDLRSIVTYFTTGYYRDEISGKWLYQEPHPYIKWVFTLSNTDLLESGADRALLRDLGRSVIDNTEFDRQLRVDKLKPDARALYALLTNEDPLFVPALIDGLSPRILDELYGIDPASQDLSQLHAQAILIHGRSDTMIPYTESVALARNLPEEQVRLYLVEGVAHVDVQPKRKDIPHLMAAMQALLAHRDHPQ